MKVLVINAGSSSLKYQLIDMTDESVLAKGNCERIGTDGAFIGFKTPDGQKIERKAEMKNHTQAFLAVKDALLDAEYGAIKDLSEVTAIGHRVVQGGAYFDRIKPAHQPFTVFDCPRVVQHHPSIWSAIYRRGFIEDANIRFKEVPGAGWVDNPFLFETMCQAKSIVFKNTPYYCYREDLPGSSSATRVLSLSFERWNDMADVVDRLNITDQGVRKALATIAFRYAGEAVGQGALDDEDLTRAMGEMFARIDEKTILSLENVSPQLRQLAFRLSGREVPKISKLGYLRGLVSEFAYSIRTNGMGFARMQTALYLRRRSSQDKKSETYEKS